MVQGTLGECWRQLKTSEPPSPASDPGTIGVGPASFSVRSSPTRADESHAAIAAITTAMATGRRIRRDLVARRRHDTIVGVQTDLPCVIHERFAVLPAGTHLADGPASCGRGPSPSRCFPCSLRPPPPPRLAEARPPTTG